MRSIPSDQPSSTSASSAHGTKQSQEAAALRALQSVALIDASPAGKIEFATGKAQTLMRKYFSREAIHQLPEFILCRLHQLPPGSTATPFSHPTNGPAQLIVHLTGRDGGNLQLHLEETRGCTSPEQLIAFGLTRREAEVLFWIARGKTSGDIATILQCKPATVTKHTERIFTKLGVETRTAAAAIVLEKIGL